MNSGNTLEVFGSLVKLEELTPLTKNVIPGTLVFDSISPFLGYYYDDPQDLSPIYIYMATDRTYSIFEILRAFQNVKTELDFNLDVAKAFVKFNDKMINVIRIRHITNYEHIKEIQKAFLKNGIKLLSCSVHCKRITASITLNKNFFFKKYCDDIYIDAVENNHSYFRIPHQLTLDEFVEITNKVRNNWFENKFDAAFGCYINDQRVIDFVRIYSEVQDVEYLQGLRKLYLQKIK